MFRWSRTAFASLREPGRQKLSLGLLIEHYAGNFLLWLSPDQVHAITLHDDEALLQQK